MNTGTLLRLAWRESRFARRRLLLFLSAISLGVAALVAVQGFADNLTRGVRDEARGLLGADMRIDSRAPYSEPVESLLDSLRADGVRVARLTSFASMARSGSTRLVQVRAPEPGYPFYGSIKTRPESAWERLHTGQNALVDPALLGTLGVEIGDSIALGAMRFEVLGTIERVPGDADIASAFAPRMFIPAAHVRETGLVDFGSRIDYEAYLRLPGSIGAEEIIEANRAMFEAERVRWDTAEEEQQDLEDAFGRMSSYLGLIGVLALLLGGIGVASAMAAYMARKVDVVAILRCLGATATQVLGIYLVQALAMGMAGASIGVAAGVAVQSLLPGLFSGLLPVEVRIRPSGSAILVGLIVGTIAAAIFAAFPLLRVRRVSPLGALRRDVEPLPATGRDWPRVALAVALVAGTFALVLFQARSVRVAAGVVAGIGTALLVLWIMASLASRWLRRRPLPGVAYTVRQGVANLHRPANQTRAIVTAIGFGVFLLATLLLTQHNILLPLQSGDPAERPNLLMWDVQDDQVMPVQEMLQASGRPVLAAAPIVPMRIAAIDGKPVEPSRDADADMEEGDPARWAVSREYRSTFRSELTGSEKLISGAFWSGAGAEPDQVSLERDIARDLGVGLGSEITWDVQGVRLTTRVTSIREVDWARFEPNFFAVFPPSALEDAPRSWVVLTRATDLAERTALQNAVVERHPNIAAIDLTRVQAALDEVIGRISAVIRFLGGFSVATGFIVLLGAVAAGRAARVRESVLLKTLGATRTQIAIILTTEYLALGSLSVIVGIVLACFAGWTLAATVFDVPFHLAMGPLARLAAGVVAVAVGVGLWAGREVFSGTALEALREE